MSHSILVFALLPFFEGAPLASQDKQMRYLYKFGYLQPAAIVKEGTGRTEPPWVVRVGNAIKKLQAAAGLEITGELDASTIQQMEQLKCGVPEPVVTGGGTRTERRVWSKRNLTYSIDKYWGGRAAMLSKEQTEKFIKDAFALFAEVVLFKFNQVPSDSHVDIRLNFAKGDHGDGKAFLGQGGVLAHAFPPGKGQVHFDEDEWWQAVQFGNIRIISKEPRYIDFLTVAVHEIGHALGLQHVTNDPTSIMAPFYRIPIVGGAYVAPILDEKVKNELTELYKTGAHSGSGGSGEPLEVLDYQKCMENVYGAMNLPGHRIVFFPEKGTRFAMFNSMSLQMVQNVVVSDLFTRGPSRVTAAYYNSTSERILLFNENRVWAYDFNKRRHEVLPARGYPKVLPVKNWRTEGALYLNPKLALVNRSKTIAYYNEGSNSMSMMGHIEQVYPAMPQDATGFAEFGYGRFVGFTQTEVFKYHRNIKSTDNLGSIVNFFDCIS